MKLTKEETSNGWDEMTLEAYRLDRDAAADKVGGLVPTEYVRPRRQPVVINANTFNAHTWRT